MEKTNEEKGYWYTETRIKEGATPIDNVTKFAWYDEDYEEVELWHEYTEEELAAIAEREAAEAAKVTADEMANAIIEGVNEVC